MIPDSERIPSQVVEDAIKGLTGKARWETAARVGEDWGYGAGWDAGMEWAARGNAAALAEMESDIMVKCPGCSGSGRMENGSQCKRCYGATVVKAVHRDRGDGTPIPELDGSSDNAS